MSEQKGNNGMSHVKVVSTFKDWNKDPTNNRDKNKSLHPFITYTAQRKFVYWNVLRIQVLKKYFIVKKITHPIINTNLHRKWLPKRRHHTIHSGF